MGVFMYEDEIKTIITPARLFKAFILDADNLIPKITPQAIKHVEILEGNRGSGTIKKITFGDGNKFKYAKHKVESIDYDNLIYSYSLIEGDVLLGKLEKISHETKIVASPDGGSMVKATNKFYTIGDTEIDEEHLKEGKEKAFGLFKIVEGYLHASPDAYN